jgi:hypothetical protein
MPQMPQAPFNGNGGGAPQGFGPPQMPQPAQQFGGPPQGNPGIPQQQGGTGTDDLKAQIAALKGLVEAQAQQISQLVFNSKINDVAMSYVLRGYFGKNMPQDANQLGLVAAFKEIGLPIPQ